jgi:protoporphyrinogen IX oxidase
MEYYQEILAFHIISVLSWMAMLFYMPRLFVYHVENIEKKEFVEVVEIQEDKIYRVIGFPAMIATLLSGGTLLFINPELLNNDWMVGKLIVLVGMLHFSFSLESYRKKLLNGNCTKNGQFFRAYNEVPTLYAILIVVFVVTKSIPIYFSIAITLFFAFVIYKILTKK